MDKLDKAIESLQNIVEYWTCRPSEIEAAKLAITALKQQQEREQGCDYCNHTDIIAGETNYDGSITADLRFDNEDYNSLDVIVCTNGSTLFDFSVDIKYCPMCGRRLEESENG